ncbi:MAG: hypothetical protein K6E18_02090 [Lachnospiraceae bacterium]|nr:hypothetical protein [Lachnospiraceae bacterium]
MRKLAVVFPGIGYNKDRPLLYYAGKLAVANGYELVHIDFSGLNWSKEKLKDPVFMEQTKQRCLQITQEAMARFGDLAGDQVLFIGKSIGTVVACAYAKTSHIAPRLILYSPLSQIEPYVDHQQAALFYGDADPLAAWTDIERIAGEKHLDAFRIKDGNHSLETGNIPEDIENLRFMMEELVRYF